MVIARHAHLGQLLPTIMREPAHNPKGRRIPNAEIQRLMVRFADGERVVFRPLFDALWPLLFAVTSRGLVDRAEAEDAAQRAMLVVFDRIIAIDPDRDAVAWAATIAAFEVLTSRRRVQRRREDFTSTALIDGTVDLAARPDEQLAAAELRAAVRAAVGELPARDQAALVELLADGPITPGEAPRKRRTRAIERLRAIWRKSHG